MKPFGVSRGSVGVWGSGLRPSPDYTDAVVLVANTQQAYTAPNGAAKVLFSSTGNFFAKLGGSASVPAANVTDGTAPELNPVGYDMPTSCNVINFNASSNCTITVCCYK